MGWALRALVVDHLTVSRVAAGLDVAWHTANTAALEEGRRLLIDDPERFDGVTVIGVDEHLLNSVLGLSILYIGTIVPFIAWMMRGFVDGVPIELEEAAMVDGCSRVGAFCRVTLPLLVPGIISTSVFGFLFAWNEYTLALIVLSKDSSVTLPIWLQSFQQGLKATDWGGVMAGATLIAVPVIIIFVLVQNKISKGMVAGAVKG